MTAAPRAAHRLPASVRRRRRRSAYLGLLAWLCALLFFVPVAWMVLTSFHSEADAATNPPSLGASLTLHG
ncbi:carbohydrate ABC transporter permease, partial [Streptomyces sp. NPDC048595]